MNEKASDEISLKELLEGKEWYGYLPLVLLYWNHRIRHWFNFIITKPIYMTLSLL
jgi:hypothetical protein